MLYHHHRSRRRTGAAAVELAMVLPLILTLLLGIWEVGRLVEIQQLLSNAAREAGRQAATGQLTNTQVKQVATNYLSVAGLPTGNVVVNVDDLTSPGTDVSKAQYMDQLQVQVSIPFNDVRWCLLSIATNASTTLNAQVQWMTMLDKAYPSLPEPPQG